MIFLKNFNKINFYSKLIMAIILTACFSVLISDYGIAEEIIFINGDRITGDIIALKGGTFEVEAAFGRIFLPENSIQRIEFNSYSVGMPSGISIIKPDDLISYIQNSKFSFYVDNEKISANNFANQIRLRWAMKMAGVKELDEFREKLVSYSPETGAHNLIEISKGKKIKVCDWLDSVLKSSRRNITTMKKNNAQRNFDKNTIEKSGVIKSFKKR